MEAKHTDKLSRIASVSHRIVIFILIVLSISTYFLLTKHIKTLRDHCLTINISGRQRMLCQRIVSLSWSLLATADSALVDHTRQKLREAINLTEESHQRLTSGKILGRRLPGGQSAQMKAIYFEPPLLLDAQVREFLSEARLLLEATISKPAEQSQRLQYLQARQEGIIEKLEAAVKQYELEARQDNDSLIRLQTLMLFINLLVILLAKLSIFNPMIVKLRHTFIKEKEIEEKLEKAIEESKKTNEQLEKYKMSLEDKVEERIGELKKRLGWQQDINLLQQVLLMPERLEEKLKTITENIVRIFNADFCRIWLIRPGDLCAEGCIHAEVTEGPHVCRYRDKCLHLLASSGRYTHINGKVHRRVPFDCYKIGRVASGHEHKFIANDVVNDPRVHNREWARELGLVAFAGYQLRVPAGEVLGVLAIFAKHPILEDEDTALDGLSNTVAFLIQQSAADEALRTSELRNRTLLENLPQKIFLKDKDSVYIFCNENYARDLKIKPEEIRGKTDYDFYSRELAEKYRQDDKRVIESEKLEDIEERYTVDRQDTFVHTVKIPVKDGKGDLVSILGIFWDISERKKIEEKLRQANEFTETIIKGIPFGMDIVDEEGNIIYLNERLAAIMRKGSFRKKCFALYKDDKQQCNNCPLKNGIEIGRMESIETGGVLGGRTFRIAHSGIIYQGRKAILEIFEDITERKKIEESSRLAQLGKLVSAMAHEVNNPLMIISGNAQLSLMEQIESEAVKKNLKIIIDESQMAKGIIQRLLKFSRPSKGETKEVDINKSIEALANIVEHQFKLVNVWIKRNYLENPPLISIDEQQMQEVFMNLINNAAEAMPKGGVITIATSLEGDFLRLDFQDVGSGMSEEVKKKVFEPFFTTKEKGTGLGLSVCYGIIKAHNGEIKFESELNKGTTVTVLLPLGGGKA